MPGNRSDIPENPLELQTGPIATPLICIEDACLGGETNERDIKVLIGSFCESINALNVNGKVTFELPDFIFHPTVKEGVVIGGDYRNLRKNQGWFVFRPSNRYPFIIAERGTARQEGVDLAAQWAEEDSKQTP